jgi:hypothetical protein
MNIFIGRLYCTAVDISWMFHLHRRITGNVDDQRIRVRHLNAKRCRQAVAHGAQTAGRHPAVRLLEVIELRRPHLVLAPLRW